MMRQAKPEIRVGARGWQHEDWVTEFYPEDLPADWRFSYYSNEYPTVLIPAEYVNSHTPADWQEWLEDAQANFSFYVEVAETALWSDLKPYLQVLGGQLKGIVLAIEKLQDMDALAKLINKLNPLAPVSLKKAAASVSDRDMKTLQTCYEVNGCWDGGSEPPVWKYGPSAIVIRDGSESNSPDVARQFIEKGFEFAENCQYLLLFFSGPSPKISEIQNVRMISELMA